MKSTRQAKEALMHSTFMLKPDLVEIFGVDGPDLIADIGACDGLSSIGYAKMFPLAKIVGFEPREDNCIEAMENFKEYEVEEQTELYQVCLSDIPGEVPFWRSSGQAAAVKDWDTGNKSSSILAPLRHKQEHPWCEFVQYYIEARTLDSYDFKIHFIHIDVQGAELKVFQGGEKTLERVRAVWCEVSTIEFYKNQPLKEEVVEYMNKARFDVKRDTCTSKSGDILFVRR